MCKPRVLVTGASGFTGHYVCKEFESQGFDVFGLTRDGSINGKSIDLCSYDEVLQCVDIVQPNSVVHLAAIAYVGYGIPNDFYRVNVEGTLNLLRSLETVGSVLGTVVLASSANVYGDVYQQQPISEDFAPKPVNDYAVSKLSMEYMACLHMNTLPIVIARPFNYTGVGQRENFLVPKIVRAFRERQPILELGNIHVSRDFSDVRDIAKYYHQLVMKSIHGQTVNLCSGKSFEVGEIIRMCEQITGHTVRVDSVERFQRENELKQLLGNPKQLISLTGSCAQYSMRDTLCWMLKK